mgnify:CR=1 FL=1
MKRVLFLKSAPGFPIQGADISVFERLHLLKKWGWEGLFVSTGQDAHAASFLDILGKLGCRSELSSVDKIIFFEHEDVPAQLYLGPNTDQFVCKKPEDLFALFEKAIDVFKPDALMANVRDVFALEFFARERSLRKLMFLTEDEYPKNGQPGADVFAKNLARIDSIVVATDYLKRSLSQEYGKNAEVLANAVAIELYTREQSSERKFITMIHPYPHKGIEFFLELVAALSDRPFLVMAGTGQEYRAIKERLLSFPNLTLSPFTKQMAKIYSASRIVLVPSLWEEGFSRVIIEAFASGTPVIHSGRGGMRQTGGDAALVVPIEYDQHGRFQTASWIDAIKRLDDESFYQERSTRALARVEEFVRERDLSLKRLAELLST